MARFNFYLKNPKNKKSSIILSITYDGKQCKYYTGISVISKNWNNRKQEIKSQVQQSSLINKTLNNIKEVAENCYWKLVKEGEASRQMDTFLMCLLEH